ncbi:MAG: hypothetical protein Q7P63_02800 [Verrucomicrobiota bacterium JB022]|nr:hypothetical protein [Verrucomicrobiota bacterium JB022]
MNATPPPLPATVVPNLPEVEARPHEGFSLPRLLRWLGGLLLASAAGKFIFTDLMERGPFGQYAVFLGFTLLIGVCGWLVTRRWQDAAAGRALLGLAAGFVPAHFGQLSALLYEARFEGLMLGAPAWSLLGLALPVLALVSWLGMSALCRSHARLLAVSFFAGQLLLLPTWRDPQWITGITVALLIATVVVLERVRRSSPGFVGLEGLLAQVAFFPAILMLPIRQVCWHHGDEGPFFLLVALTLAYLFNGVFAPGVRNRVLRGIVETGGLLWGFAAWLLGAQLLFGWHEELLAFAALLYAVPVMLWSLTRSVEQGQWIRSVAAFLLMLVALLSVGEDAFPLMERALVGLAVGAALLACHLRERLLLTFALLALIVSGCDNAYTLWTGLFRWHWSLLGVAGLVIILLASWLERLDARRVYHHFKHEWR